LYKYYSMGPSAKLELVEELKQLKLKDAVDTLEGFSVELLLAVGGNSEKSRS
jgi:hypothetical protein